MNIIVALCGDTGAVAMQPGGTKLGRIALRLNLRAGTSDQLATCHPGSPKEKADLDISLAQLSLFALSERNGFQGSVRTYQTFWKDFRPGMS